ncbi:MAG: response regulator [Peptostreptococcaceae bacterium]|nr:response regulator [Peptostreptococcaceae bacterium]MDY5739197.1 response regulator [Anaerovoracaceae bacterium]
MRYIVLDDEIIAANYLAELIKENDEDADVTVINNPLQALKLAEKEHFDVYFIDIQMPGINGVEFATELKKKYPKSNFVFVTGYADYMANAFELDASDYLMKPATSIQVGHAIENLRYSTENSGTDGKKHRIKIICFGNFDVLIDNVPIRFKFDKTKELMAYLIHRRGSRCTSKEIMATLWEDEGHDSYYRMLKKDLYDSLNELGCGDIIYSERGRLGIAKLDCIDCDYFKWLRNKEAGSKLYNGEYMAQYSWAEEVNALIEFEKYSYK